MGQVGHRQLGHSVCGARDQTTALGPLTSVDPEDLGLWPPLTHSWSQSIFPGILAALGLGLGVVLHFQAPGHQDRGYCTKGQE